MGFNFRKSFSLGNGVRVTVGKKSASVSVGRKGVRGTLSTTGKATGTVSIPGTGLSYSASKKISDIIPGKKDEEKEKKPSAGKTAAKTSSSKTASAKSTTAKTSSSKTASAKSTTAKTSSSKTASAKSTTAKTSSSKTASAKSTSVKTATAKTTAKKPAPAKAAPEPAAETPSNPFSTGKAKKVTED